jgi:hypothetical protein
MIKTVKLFICLATILLLTGCQKENDYLNNSVPVVNAGLSQTITLPTNSITLTGTGADADGDVVAYLWSQVDGPSESVIVNPGSATTMVKNLIEGSYIFQLMATDNGGATGVDTLKVTVLKPKITSVTITDLTELKVLRHGVQDYTQVGLQDIVIEAWTHGGVNYDVRSLLKFNLSTIPANAKIISATLSLYSYPTPTLNGNLIDANHGANNSFTVQQVTSQWTFPGVTWYNQPGTTTTNQVVVPATAQSNLDLNLDVTNMVSLMVNNSANNGFLLKLQNEVQLNCRIFVSGSNAAHASKKPKLVVVYE